MRNRHRHRHHQQFTTGAEGPTLDGQAVGAALRLVGVEGGPGRTRRLMSLGLRPGQVVIVTHARGRGVVVASEAGRVAVGPEMARHIRVEAVA